MVVEFLEEPLEEWVGQDVTVWRCVICGDIVDPVVLAHRVSRTNTPLPPDVSRTGRMTPEWIADAVLDDKYFQRLN